MQYKNNKPKTTSNHSIAGTVFETLKDLGKQTVKSAVQNTGAMLYDGARSVTGFQQPSSTLRQNPATPDMVKHPMTPEYLKQSSFSPRKEKTPKVEVFSYAERREVIETRREIEKLVYMIKDEISKIEKTNKMMITETAKITVEQLPQNPGIYHVRFFEWLLNLLRDIRKKVSESASWLAVARGKRKKSYWGMVKKKGTSFLLSGERTASTQGS